MALLGLHELSNSTHPLIEEGNFSILTDEDVEFVSDISVITDLDGYVFMSR